MENHKLVRPENLNHYGYLFGGDLLKWVDEYAWIAATLDYPGCNFATVGMDKVEFRRSVREGTILRFVVERTREGNTSVQYSVTVVRGQPKGGDNDVIFSTHVSFVNMGYDGCKKLLPGKGPAV